MKNYKLAYTGTAHNTVIRQIRLFLAITLLVLGCSCNYSSNKTASFSPQVFNKPVYSQLRFSASKKIDWDRIATANIFPEYKNLKMAALPAQKFSATTLSPFKNTVITAKINLALRKARSLDIDKLPSISLRYKSYVLPAPTVVASAPMELKAGRASLYEFGAKQGLQKGAITTLYTDRHGLVWIAAFHGGLYRYDGESLWSYLPGPFDNVISNIAEDGEGRIWISVVGVGIEILDLKNGLLKKLEKPAGVDAGQISQMICDSRQRIWVGFNSGGVGVIDTRKQTIRMIGKAQGLSANGVISSVAEDGRRNIWVATYGGGIDEIDAEGKRISYFNQAMGLRSDSVASLVYDRKRDAVWMAFRDGAIGMLNEHANTVQTISEIVLQQKFRVHLFESTDGNIWAGTGQGAYVLDVDKHLMVGIAAPDGLNGTFIQAFQEDNSRQVWVATNEGLSVLNTRVLEIEHISAGKTASLCEDHNHLLWQGTTEGVYIVDRQHNTIKHIGKKEGLGTDSIQTIREIGDEMFICSNSGLDIIDSARTTIMHIGLEQGLANRIIYSIAQDSKGRIWIGGDQDGIDIFDIGRHTLKHLGKGRGLSDGRIIDDIAADAKGNMWVSTRYGGINVIDLNSWSIRYLSLGNGVKELLNDGRGNMWIGTPGGIQVADMPHKKLVSFSEPQGLISDVVLSMLTAGNKIYAGTDNGITEITPPAGGVSDSTGWELRSFGAVYGATRSTTGSSFNDLITRDGQYCLGDDGFTLLNLPKRAAAPYPVYITGLNVMDEPRFFDDGARYKIKAGDTLWGQNNVFYMAGQTPPGSGYTPRGPYTWKGVEGPYNIPLNLTMPFDQNFLQFHFNIPGGAGSDGTRLAYKLQGFDEHWNRGENISVSKSYFNLPPGRYVFEVTGKTMDAAWSRPATFYFTIAPPWWRTWWAYGMYVLLFSLCVWVFGHYRSRKLVRDNRRLEERVRQSTEEVVQQKEEIEAQRDHLEKIIDELQTAQSQLVQSEKLASLGELTAAIAHEIQNPLNFVNNFSELSIELLGELAEEHNGKAVDGPESEIFANLGQNLQKIHLHGKRAEGIVKTMLQHSRNNTAEREITDINALTAEYMRLAYSGLRAKDQTFSCSVMADQSNKLPMLNVVPQEIGRVILNIFNNAFYAVHQKNKMNLPGYQPKVLYRTFVEDNKLKISIKDNGNGIPKNIVDKVMQPFFTTKPTGEGTGLGLSLSHDILVKGYGGNIQLDTLAGEYTEFTIELPV